MAASSSSSSSSSPLFDDSDWELIGDAIHVSDDVDWVITGDDDDGDGEYLIPVRSMSGVFVPFKNRPTTFISLHKKACDPFVPSSYSVSSSSGGLILCCAPWSLCCVSNPSSGAHYFLPKPPRPFHPWTPLAIALLRGHAYHVILAFPGAHTGSYSFTSFSSFTGAWTSSGQEFALPSILPNTGVSVGSSAYWRTETETVVEYDVLADQARTLTPPVRSLEAITGRWQLGRLGDDLCCALVTESNLEVYALYENHQWKLLCSIDITMDDDDGNEWDGSEPIVCKQLPQPLKFESRELDVLFMVDGKLVVLGLEKRKMRIVEVGSAAPDCYDEYVAYVDDPSASPELTVGAAPIKYHYF